VRKLLVVITLAALVLCVFAGTATANKPERETFSDSFDSVSRACGFKVHVHEEFVAKQTSFFNSDGRFIRGRQHVTYNGTWTNNASGAWLVERETLSFVFVRSPREARVIGLNWHFKLPSGKTVAIDAGKLVFDRHGLVFEAGNHEIEDSRFEVLCPYLG
jgi:hypothetical protein